MERIGVRELRQNASRYLERVKKGESIEVTERGVPIAVLGPLPVREQSLYERLVAEGALVPPKHDALDWLEKNPLLPPEPGDKGPTLSETVVRRREDERY